MEQKGKLEKNRDKKQRRENKISFPPMDYNFVVFSSLCLMKSAVIRSQDRQMLYSSSIIQTIIEKLHIVYTQIFRSVRRIFFSSVYKFNEQSNKC